MLSETEQTAIQINRMLIRFPPYPFQMEMLALALRHLRISVDVIVALSAPKEVRC
jgi:hypothetical protein